jgi:CRISPR-associated protein Cas10/Cmr2 subtype III-B
MNDWKCKLAAYLHDPPEKALDIAWHKQRAEAHQSGHGLEDEWFQPEADHTAAASDRLPWPTHHHLECAFDGQSNHFKHPLGKAVLKIPPFDTPDLATAKAWDSRPILDWVAEGVESHQAQFIAYWRLWRWWASDQRSPKDPRMAFLPADTRLPDHTIWAHNSLVSALQGCVVDGKCQPAFLLFNIGPVQDFIAAARRTLDLWSGSYLLSYLVGSALKRIALTLGPGNVIFPNLCGQPIFDLLLREDIWSKASIGEKPVWDSLGYGKGYPERRILTPSLPNRFLVLAPAPQAEVIARQVEETTRRTLADIAASVWKLAEQKIDPVHSLAGQKNRFFAQIEHHLEISWQIVHWPETPDQALGMTAHLPRDSDHQAGSGLETVLDMAAKMPKPHRDVRNFDCERFAEGSQKGWKDKTKLRDDAKLDNPGAAWSALYSLVNWQLDGVRSNRAWKAWCSSGESVALMNNKDSLTGKEEGVLNLASAKVPADELVLKISKAVGPSKLFKKGEILGAMTLVKRLWPFAWLKEKHGFSEASFRVPDTRLIAQGRPFDDSDAEGDEKEDGPAYFAVLAFDGDEMGQWISGVHRDMPKLGDLLAGYEAAGQRKGAKKYFEDMPGLAPLLSAKRPLNPSFHLQFSEMLGTFSNICARRIVEAFDGSLIYSGGDDVLAMVPAGKAIACARALRAAFRGSRELNNVKGGWEVDATRGHREKNPNLKLFNVTQEGFIQLHEHNHLAMDGEPKNFPAIVPGPAAECSVGIAIAHFKAPLQDVVRAAQIAEKRAKRKPGQDGLGRGAVAVTLMKHSGEIIEWGTKWDGGLILYQQVANALEAEVLSSKFPHRFAELLEAYVTESTPLIKDKASVQPVKDFPVDDIIRREFEHCLSRQRGSKFPKDKPKSDELLAPLRSGLGSYLDSLTSAGITNAEKRLQALIGLCQTVAFAHRIAAPLTNPSSRKATHEPH